MTTNQPKFYCDHADRHGEFTPITNDAGETIGALCLECGNTADTHKAARAAALDGVAPFGRWNVRVVQEGDHYGLDDCLTHDEAEPLVEFYDAKRVRDAFGERGQFVSRYYLTTLQEHQRGVGLCLDFGIPSWTVDGDTMTEVLDWLNQ